MIMPRTTDLERPAQKRKREKYNVGISLWSLQARLAEQQNFIGAVSNETFSVSDTLYVNSTWKAIDTEDAWADHEGWDKENPKTKEEFLADLGYIEVEIEEPQNTESIVEDTFNYED